MSSGYVARETAGNLRRNLVMTMSAILTMAVSLTALGGVFIMRQAIAKASIQTRGGVLMAIFLQPQVTGNQTQAVDRELATTPGVKRYYFVDKPHAYAEFKQIFGGQNDIVSVLTVADMPPSFRVVPTKAEDITQLSKQFQGQPGVLRVAFPKQEIDQLLKRFGTLRTIGYALTIGVMIGSVALIVNTIQLAIFARRREVGVMKLVGATNWFIRVPFMLEGLIHGVVGALVAFGIVYGFRDTIASFVSSESFFGGSNLVIAPHEAIYTGIVLLAVGVLVGMLGSAFAIRRFLAV